MRDLKITLIQAEQAWEDIEGNLDAFSRHLEQRKDDSDLIVLPEMFTTGFTMNASRLAQEMDGTGVRWLKDRSRSCRADIVASLIIRDEKRFFNRLVWAKPDGRLFSYDKRHLFRMAGEEKVYSPGDRKLTVDLCGWKIRPFICYDLRFPVWTRNFANAYDLALFIANWPGKRADHWRVLLRARAVENQAFVIGLNRIGEDGAGLSYSGDSMVIDPTGRVLFDGGRHPAVKTVRIRYDSLSEYRTAFPAWRDADRPDTSMG
jgi:omega-amidase